MGLSSNRNTVSAYMEENSTWEMGSRPARDLNDLTKVLISASFFVRYRSLREHHHPHKSKPYESSMATLFTRFAIPRGSGSFLSLCAHTARVGGVLGTTGAFGAHILSQPPMTRTFCQGTTSPSPQALLILGQAVLRPDNNLRSGIPHYAFHDLLLILSNCRRGA